MSAHACIAGGRVVAAARAWIGTPYRHQASLIGVGCDCLGLVRGVWRAIIGAEPEDVPAYAPDWAEAGAGEPLIAAGQRHFMAVPLADLAAGDVLVFRWREGVAAKHLGIATAPDRMVHAHDGACVCEVALVPAWRRRLVAVFRFPPLA